MSLFGNLREKAKKIKGAEWAVFLIVLGLAGSLLLTPGTSLFGGSVTPTPSPQPSDELETRLARVLSSIEGAGKVEVVIHYAQPASSGNWMESQKESEREPIGVVVVAEGAESLSVRLELARAVQTLLRLDADAVDVFKMGATYGEE